MYVDHTADEESRVPAMAVVAAGTTAWLLINGDEMEVEDDDEDKEAEAAAEVEHDLQLRAAMEAERIAAVEKERVAEAAEWATHWATEMDTALAYRRGIDRRDVHPREAVRHAKTEHCLERHRTLRCQQVAIRAAMAAIDAAGIGDGAAL
jgi:hypothetical protein